MMPQIIPKDIFHTVSMDVIGPIPPSKRGHAHILVIQDMTSRLVELVPLEKNDGDQVAEAFVGTWVRRYGAPMRLLTDRGTPFLGEIMRAVCRLFGIQKANTTAYRPEGNGANERMHQELTKYLGIYLANVPLNSWEHMLWDAQWAHNSAYHTAMKMAPYEIAYVKPPSADVIGIPSDAEYHKAFHQWFGISKRELIEKRKALYQNMKNAQLKELQRCNEWSHRIPFEVGQFVWRKLFRPMHKWDVKFEGPFEIVGQISPVVYQLNEWGKITTIHASYLKRYTGPLPPPPARTRQERHEAWFPPERMGTRAQVRDQTEATRNRDLDSDEEETVAEESDAFDEDNDLYIQAGPEEPLPNSLDELSNIARRAVELRSGGAPQLARPRLMLDRVDRIPAIWDRYRPGTERRAENTERDAVRYAPTKRSWRQRLMPAKYRDYEMRR
jgi:hypothetical protein